MPTDESSYEESEEQRRKRKERHLEQMSEAANSKTADNPFAHGIAKEKASQFLEGFLRKKQK